MASATGSALLRRAGKMAWTKMHSACPRRSFALHIRATGAVQGLRGVPRQFQSRPITSFFSNRKLKALEEAAAKNPADAQAQAKFLQALNVSYPQQVRTWFESGKYAVNNAVIKEYVAAMAKLGKLDSLDVKGLVQGFGGAMGAGAGAGNAGAGAAAMQLAYGSSPQSPLYINAPDTSWKAELWKTARALGVGFLVLVCVGAFFDRNGGGIASKLFPQGGSNVQSGEDSNKRFSDVVGVDEAKEELQEIVEYLKDPKRFTRLGGTLPKGMLLTGPPGTGKTLLARAIAGEAGVPFFFTSGSEFEEMFVGVGAKRVRDMFAAAKAASPCIIFIDEIDAVGGKRQNRSDNYSRMTLNQLLVELDGFQQNDGVMVIAATNFPESLDSALTRPGRLDSKIDVPLPDIKGRKQILELYASKVKMAQDVDMDSLAKGTGGMSGADLANLVNQAAVRASMTGLNGVTTATLEWARDRVMMGAERKSAVISMETARMTAYHEGGHALMALLTPGANPIHKATIMPRGRTLGMVMQLPEGDQTSRSRKQMLAYLDVCMGGRVAEEMIFGEENVTSGASSDIQQATNMARMMVTKLGMSSKVGVVFHGLDRDEESPETKEAIDSEVRMMLEGAYKRAQNILSTHRDKLELIAQALIEYETLTGQELQDIVKGKDLKKAKAEGTKIRAANAASVSVQ